MPSSVLVIEDERVLCKNIVKHLKNSGHTVASAEDGAKGFEEVKRIRPDIVILDIRNFYPLPVEVGSIFARQIF